jgi:DNA-binding response OmpR family regulator
MAGTSKEVLIVDDDRALARSLERAIAQEGYPVRTVHDGESALREIRQQQPGLVLLDLLIPARDGRGVLRALRDAPETRELPIVAMSGIFRGRNHADELVKQGAQAFLEKPFRRSDLLPLLRRHLGRPPRADSASAATVDGDAGVSLAEQPVARLIWEAIEQKRTGTLVFQSAKRRKLLLVREGEPISIASNVARECLGNRLLASGQISEAALHESLRRSRAEERLQGEVLVELGAISASAMDRALRSQAEEKLLDLFSWSEGEMVFRDGETELPRASTLDGWTPLEVILRGVLLMSPARIEQLLLAHWEERVTRTRLELGPRESALRNVAALLRELTNDSVVSRLAGDHGATLYGLWLVGALRFGDKLASAPGTLALDELRTLVEQQERMTHFEVLGLGRDATDDLIRRAYVKQAKRFHPDRYSNASEDLRELAARAFARVAEAHALLADPAARNGYLEALRKGGTGATADAKRVNDIVRAESEFQKGEAMFRKRDYAAAHEHFQKAVELNPDEGDFQAYVGWTYFLSRREAEDARKVAEERLERGTQLAPNSASAHYLMGLFRKACEDPQAAERMFRKVVELAPGHVEAERELRLLNLRKDRSGDKLRGIFGIGKKKN